ncbi:hypothetical protein FSP39_015173 [Pinctada imbricata]|uniref:Fucosyltransferase n=1 Tax=Pinctada imbricata TaxID=66713 RepID=A0AA89BZG5_PINIB|nr:hypothetical protein FSP39_015173 [Pinctada imbricata]
MKHVELIRILFVSTILFVTFMLIMWFKTAPNYIIPILKEYKIIPGPFKYECQDGAANPRDSHTEIKKICAGNGSMWTGAIDFNVCEVKGCILEYNLSKSDECHAVMLQSNHLEDRFIPRQDEQVWIIVSHETPFTLTPILGNKKWRGAFNWIFSYQRNSDIFFPWGEVIAKTYIPKRNYSAIFDAKNGTAVWLSSNCRTQSRRDEYVNIMGNIIDIDIYGKCGNLSCRNIIRKDDPNDVCRNEKSIQYKFYLSFENALCPDYITEKVYLFYQYDRQIIPVIRGIQNADEFLPKNTYVDASKFDNATQLAHYLKVLGNDRERYIAMLKEKDKYTVDTIVKVFETAMCSLCAKLHDSFNERCIDTKVWKSQQLNECRNPHDLM